MKTRFQNLYFGERLQYLYSDNGINTDVRGWASPVAVDFFKMGIFQYKDNSQGQGADLNRKLQRDNVKTQLTKHLRLESVEQISTAWILRYCQYFDCSSAYLFGEIPLPTAEQTDVCAVTGLSPDAVKSLIKYHKADDEQHTVIDAINILFDYKHTELLQSVYKYCVGRVVFPSDNLKIYDDHGNGYAVAPADVFREIELHRITRALDSIADKRKRP